MTEQNVFYKFRPIRPHASKKRIKGIVIRNELWYAKPSTLNDPFDCTPYVVRNGEADGVAGRVLLSSIEERTGILSLSDNPISPQQWSYYAEDHYGVCFGIHMGHVEDQEKYTVSYSDDRIAIPDELIQSEDEKDKTEVTRLLVSSVTTKSKAWEHEKEVRFLKMKSDVFEFPPKSLVSVYFGCRCRESDIRYVEQVVTRSACEPHYAFVQPSGDKYELEIVPDDIDHVVKAMRKIRGV